VRCWPVSVLVQIRYLDLSQTELGLHPRQRRPEKVLPPLRIEQRIQIDLRRVWRSLDCGSPLCILAGERGRLARSPRRPADESLRLPPLLQLVLDPPGTLI